MCPLLASFPGPITLGFSVAHSLKRLGSLGSRLYSSSRGLKASTLNMILAWEILFIFQCTALQPLESEDINIAVTFPDDKTRGPMVNISFKVCCAIISKIILLYLKKKNQDQASNCCQDY